MRLYILVFILFSNFSFANSYRSFLFIPNNQAKIIMPEITVNDSSAVVYGYVTGGLSGASPARVASSRCLGNNNNLKGTQDKTAWFLIPKEVDYNGIRVKLEVLSTGGWVNPNQPVNDHYSAKVYQKKLNNVMLFNCWREGEQLMPDMIWSTASIKVEIPKQRLKPGRYSIPVNYYYAFEENKYTERPADSSDIPYKILISDGSQGMFVINVNVVSVCNIVSSQSKIINLSHGSMSSLDADGQKTQPYNVKFKCKPGTSIKVTLKGGVQVPGRTKNFTKCGSGNCEINFNGNKYDENVKADRYGDVDLSITSTYHLDNHDVVGGAFQGSAVLTYLID